MHQVHQVMILMHLVTQTVQNASLQVSKTNSLILVLVTVREQLNSHRIHSLKHLGVFNPCNQTNTQKKHSDTQSHNPQALQTVPAADTHRAGGRGAEGGVRRTVAGLVVLAGDEEGVAVGVLRHVLLEVVQLVHNGAHHVGQRAAPHLLRTFAGVLVRGNGLCGGRKSRTVIEGKEVRWGVMRGYGNERKTYYEGK